MTCGFAPCTATLLPLTLDDSIRQENVKFCGHAHLLAFLVMRLGASTQNVIQMALIASKTPEGRKSIVHWLADKVL